MPPNGWGCKCRVRALSKAQSARRGGTGKAPPTKTRPWLNKRTGQTGCTGQTGRIPLGIDPGWDTNPGKVRRWVLTKRGWARRWLSKPKPGTARNITFPSFMGSRGLVPLRGVGRPHKPLVWGSAPHKPLVKTRGGVWGSAPQILGENKRRGGAGKAPPTKTRPWQTERTGQTGRVPRGIDPGKARRHAMAGWGKYSGRKPQRGNAGSPCCRPQFHGVCGGNEKGGQGRERQG